MVYTVKFEGLKLKIVDMCRFSSVEATVIVLRHQ